VLGTAGPTRFFLGPDPPGTGGQPICPFGSVLCEVGLERGGGRCDFRCFLVGGGQGEGVGLGNRTKVGGKWGEKNGPGFVLLFFCVLLGLLFALPGGKRRKRWGPKAGVSFSRGKGDFFPPPPKGIFGGNTGFFFFFPFGENKGGGGGHGFKGQSWGAPIRCGGGPGGRGGKLFLGGLKKF